jgi:hypothetical protein
MATVTTSATRSARLDLRATPEAVRQNQPLGNKRPVPGYD